MKRTFSLAAVVGALALAGLIAVPASVSLARADDEEPTVIVIDDARIVGGDPALAVLLDMLAVADDDKHTARIVIAGDDDDRPWLGVFLAEETDDPEGGARIVGVAEDSPAEQAGLEQGDVIVGLDGNVIRGPMALTKRIREHDPGDEITLEVNRDGDRRTVQVELGEHSGVLAFSWGGGEPRILTAPKIDLPSLKRLEVAPHVRLRSFSVFGQRPKLGVQLVQATPELREHLGGEDDTGVLVGKVLKGMPAEHAGIQVGDLITAVDGEPVSSAGEIIEALRDKSGETVVIDLIRDGRPMSFDVELPKPASGETA